MLDCIFIMLCIICICYIIYNYGKYDSILEFPKNYYFGMENIYFIGKNNNLYKKLKEFVLKNPDNNYIVSLSGGVDSMVTLCLLINVVNRDKIYTASIDYNQRTESSSEINFVKKFSEKFFINNYSSKVEGISRKQKNSKRKVFEETSQKIRYDLYRKIIKENSLDKKNTIILLGHHKDDLRENIFNNFILGRRITDLEVMKEKIVKEGLIFGRPFLDYPKSEILRTAHLYYIPYLKDTTPDWSKRGLMRKKLFPLLRQIYPNFESVLDNQGKDSNNLGILLRETFIENFINDVKCELCNNNIILEWDNFKYFSNNKLIWGDRLSILLHNLGVSMISNKSLEIFMKNRLFKNYCMLSKNVMLKKTSNKTILKIKNLN